VNGKGRERRWRAVCEAETVGVLSVRSGGEGCRARSRMDEMRGGSQGGRGGSSREGRVSGRNGTAGRRAGAGEVVL
jgi:hypothetical protein